MMHFHSDGRATSECCCGDVLMELTIRVTAKTYHGEDHLEGLVKALSREGAIEGVVQMSEIWYRCADCGRTIGYDPNAPTYHERFPDA